MLTTFGKTVKSLQIRSDQKLYEMAEKLGITPQKLSCVMHGRNGIPDSLVEQIVSAYNLSASEAARVRGAAQETLDSVEGTPSGIWVSCSGWPRDKSEVLIRFLRKLAGMTKEDRQKMRDMIESFKLSEPDDKAS